MYQVHETKEARIMKTEKEIRERLEKTRYGGSLTEIELLEWVLEVR